MSTSNSGIKKNPRKGKRGIPGELHLTNLFGATPGSASYLMEPFLDTNGRLRYKEGVSLDP